MIEISYFGIIWISPVIEVELDNSGLITNMGYLYSVRLVLTVGITFYISVGVT